MTQCHLASEKIRLQRMFRLKLEGEGHWRISDREWNKDKGKDKVLIVREIISEDVPTKASRRRKAKANKRPRQREREREVFSKVPTKPDQRKKGQIVPIEGVKKLRVLGVAASDNLPLIILQGRKTDLEGHFPNQIIPFLFK